MTILHDFEFWLHELREAPALGSRTQGSPDPDGAPNYANLF
jgi:hypothetical protein